MNDKTFPIKDRHGNINNLPQVPSVNDEVDIDQFIFPNDPSGLCMIHIPYNYFCLFTAKREQKAIKEFLQELKKINKAEKEVVELFNSKLEKDS